MTRLHYLIFWGLISGTALFLAANTVYWLRRVALVLEAGRCEACEDESSYDLEDMECPVEDCPCCRSNG